MPRLEANNPQQELKPKDMMYGDLEKAVDRASDDPTIKRLTREIRERIGIPKHDEISKAYEGGTFETRTQIAEGLLSKVFGEAEIKGLGGKFTHVPSPVETSDENDSDSGHFGHHNPFNGEEALKSEKPQFYVTEVWEEKTTFSLRGKKTEKTRTNEVVVTVRLNNNPQNSTENTIIVAVLGHKNGVIDVKNGVMSGLFEVMSEDEYTSRLHGNTSVTYLAEVLRGELSSKKYKEEVGKVFGTSFKGYHKERDKNLGKEYANWVSNEVAPRLLDKLQIRYETLLQESRKRIKEIHEETESDRDRGFEYASSLGRNNLRGRQLEQWEELMATMRRGKSERKTKKTRKGKI